MLLQLGATGPLSGKRSMPGSLGAVRFLLASTPSQLSGLTGLVLGSCSRAERWGDALFDNLQPSKES